MTEKKFCPTCGSCLSPYKVTITQMMVDALIKFRMAVIDKGENSVHLLKDMKGKSYELTRHEWNNFSRERFLAFAVKVEDKSGYWLLTKRGADFLNGELAVPYFVWIFNNKIIERSEKKVYVKDILGTTPYMETKSDIEYGIPESAKEYLQEPGQVKLF
jgi:hypothetical protein